jgi:hypothetical protein
MQDTFCPTSRRVQFCKATCSSLVVCVFFFSIHQFNGPFVSGYLRYLEHWGLLLSTLYMLLSMMNSLMGAKQPWNAVVVEGRARWSWMLFIMASHLECIMTIVYWTLMYEPGVTRITFLIVMKYGGVAIQVFLDGLYMNRIPLRWMFYWGLLWFVDMIYILYSVLYTFYLSQDATYTTTTTPAGTATPGQPSPQVLQETTTEPLYPFLDWKGDWQYALIVSVIFVCALSPAVHLFLWLSSLYRWPFCLCCRQEYRRYFARKVGDHKKKTTREERRLEREEVLLRKQREREEAADAVAADMVRHDNLQKHFNNNNNNNRCNRNGRNGDNQSICDTTANESATCWTDNDSFSTMASGAAGGSFNDLGSHQVSSASASVAADVGGGECAPIAAGTSGCGIGGDSWQSNFTMPPIGDIDEEGEDDYEETTTTTRSGEDFVDEHGDESFQDSNKPAAVRP